MATAEAVVAGIWLAVIAVYDLRHLRIPNWLLVLGLLLAATYVALHGGATQALWGLMVGLGTMVVAAQIWMFAPGDQKLAAVLGALLGALAVLVAIGIALVGAGLWISYRRPRREAFPFAPFLALGALVAYGAVG
jgi:leader peptidase (prepilin peptidase)/N-methyltransferase